MFSSTVKYYSMRRMHCKMTTLSNLHHNEGYFRQEHDTYYITRDVDLGPHECSGGRFLNFTQQ